MPQMIRVKWGLTKVYINNLIYRFKDCKVWPDHCIIWNWNITGTRHSPGVQIEDFKEFIDKVDIIILTEGYYRLLRITRDALDYLKYCELQGKKYYIERTPEAVELYNKLSADGKKVGILVHSTC